MQIRNKITGEIEDAGAIGQAGLGAYLAGGEWEIINGSNGGASVKGATATYDESSTTETSATPTGATEISWLAIGGT